MNRSLKVFIMEDEEPNREQIVEDLKEHNYQINFFSKRESLFDLLKFSPDILIQDYHQKKVINFHEWTVPM